MTTTITRELQIDQLREGLTRYTRKAFLMLPALEKPSILDIGCGTGIPAIELARLSNGQITGLDISQPFLDEFVNKVEAAGLSDRVKAVNCSLFAMEFPDECFDIIWSEGSIFVIGFERGLKEWRRLLKPDGFLVVHDALASISNKLKQITQCGYELLGCFTVTEETWQRDYFQPLEKRIQNLRHKYSDDPEARAALDEEQREVDTFKRNPEGSVYFILQKSSSQPSK